MPFRLLFLFLLLTFSSHAQQNVYHVQLDVNAIEKDRLTVRVNLPRMMRDTIDYLMPVMVPGVYARAHYGKYISNFKAIAKDGSELKVKRKGKEKFRIFGGRNLDYITYEVDDSWEKINFIFRPAGTNFEAGKNFMLNHSVYIGYVEGFKHLPYDLDISRPEKFYGATAMKVMKRGINKDRYRAKGYDELVDNPILLCVPDTASHQVGHTRVHVAVYSETGMVKASDINGYIQPLTEATAEFLGTLPVRDYHYLFYFTQEDGMISNLNKGALEHHQSSVYYLTETESKGWLQASVRSIAAHEFLHILTPLHLHSEHIADFNFYNPSMSQHLWLYEGVTEYLSMLLEVKTGLISQAEFVNRMNRKIRNAEAFKPYSFTEMSMHITDGKGLLKKLKQSKKYGDVYEKGAVLAFLLDIRINELSKGKEGLLDVIQKLTLRYGKDRPFSDYGFIDDFVTVTYPELKDFFTRYVEGNEPLPLKEYCAKINWDFVAAKESRTTYVKSAGFKWTTKGYQLSSMGKNTPGLMTGDILVTINGKPVANPSHVNPLFYTNPGKEISIEVMRKDIKLLLKTADTFTTKNKNSRIYYVEGDHNDLWKLVFQ